MVHSGHSRVLFHVCFIPFIYGRRLLILFQAMDDIDALNVLEAEVGLDAPIDPLDDIPLGDDTPRYNPDQMLPLLQSENLPQRMLAARAFYKIQEPRAIPWLIELLDDDSPLVRVNAAYALGRNPSETAVDALINQLTNDSHGYVRKAVVWALGNCRNEKAVVPLIQAIKNDMSVVRLWAASALGQMGKISFEAILKAIPALVETMRNDPIAIVRSNCAWSVGELCKDLPNNVVYATAIDALIETFADDEDLGGRDDARAAILNLGDPRGLQVIEEIEQEEFYD